MSNVSFKNFLQITESIEDKGIFKAIFVIGIPGAGKSYTISKIMSGDISPRIINTDIATEFIAKKLNKDVSKITWPSIRDKSLKITKDKLYFYLNGVLPLFIDGTSSDASNILHRIGILESLGYDIGLVYIKTPLEIAIKRAQVRAEKIKRFVNIDFIKNVHEKSDENFSYLKNKVNFFIEYENESDEIRDEEIIKLYKKTKNFFSVPVINPLGQRKIQKMKLEKIKYLVPQILSEEVLRKKVDGWYKS